MKDRSVLSFYIDPKLHENFKIRLYYDGFANQSEFFRACVTSYLDQEKTFVDFLEEYKLSESLQSKAKITKSKKLRQQGEKLMKDLALSAEEVENIFDILEEELPEL